MSTGTNAAPASSSNFSFSASNRGAGQTISVPSTQIVPSVGARTPLPDNEDIIDEEMPAVREAGRRRPRPSRSESSVGNGYRAIHDTASSGRAQPNAIVPRASGQSVYGTHFTVAVPGGLPGKFARVEDRLMMAEAARWRAEEERMRRILEESVRRPRREIAWGGASGESSGTVVV